MWLRRGLFPRYTNAIKIVITTLKELTQSQTTQ